MEWVPSIGYPFAFLAALVFRAKCPRSVFTNRDSHFFVAISRRMAL
jgi:hypothetical protein